MTLSGGARAPVSAMFVESWAAVVLERPDGLPQRLGSCAEEGAIPAALRRRLGPFGRMAVSCALGVSTEDSDIVFCSRYGDVGLAYRLLVDLVEEGPLSPAGFSLSVHNAVPGAVDLVRKSRVGHTAIAAGSESLSAGLCEVLGKLTDRPNVRAMLLYAEYALPPIYREFSTSSTEGIALALSLSTVATAKSSGCLKIESDDGALSFQAPDSEVLARALIGSLGGMEPREIRWNSRGLTWSFTAGADAPA